MSDDNRALLRRWFDEVWNQNRAGAVEELLAHDVIVHGLGEDGEPRFGREHFRQFYQVFRASLSDLCMTVDDVIGEGDQAVARVTLRATHSGPGFGVAATGRPIVTTGIVWTRWRDGRIAEAWNEFDAAGLLRQISGPSMASVKTT